MSNSNTDLMIKIGQSITIYVGIFFLIFGIIGETMNIIIFLSLKTFRSNCCSFYLLIMSFINLIHILSGLFTYVMIYGFLINWLEISLFYCKFRSFYIQLNILMSFTCLCLATLDQYFATCSNPRFHQFNNIKLARYFIFGSILIWILHGIPYLIYFNHSISSITGLINCINTNFIFQKYTTIIYTPILISGLPVLIMIIFGSLSYRNVQQIAYRTIPLVRRELDKQLTIMVLIEVFYNVIAMTPLIIQSISLLIINTPTNFDTVVKINLIKNITTVLHNLHFVSSFYIYLCVSKRFRQQFLHVLFKIHLNRWCYPIIINNQIEPQT